MGGDVFSPSNGVHLHCTVLLRGTICLSPSEEQTVPQRSMCGNQIIGECFFFSEQCLEYTGRSNQTSLVLQIRLDKTAQHMCKS